MPPVQQMTPQMMQVLQQLRQPPSQPGQPQLPPQMQGAMMPPQGSPMSGGGFLGAAQAQPAPGAMPSAGDAPSQLQAPRMMPPGSGEPDGMPQQPQGTPQGGGIQQMDPKMQGAMMNMIQGMPPEAKQMLIQHLTQSLAASGRGGDNTIAHLTPGEITVPPQVQSPKVLATLNKAFKDKGAAAHQFTVGSPTQSVNPQTGVPEFGFFNSSFMKAALPIALGVGGSMLLPGIGTALAAGETGALAGAGTAAAADAAATTAAAGTAAAAPSLALSSLGSGLGTTAGGLLTGQKPMQAIGSGIGAGVGGYALGNISNGMTAMGSPTGSPASAGGGIFNSAPTAAVAPNTPWAGSSGPSIMGHAINPYQMAGSAAGSAAGGYLGAAMAKQSPQGPQLPKGFGDHYTPGVGSPRDQLGQTNYAGATPNFTGYNPFTNSPSAFNFYPNRT